MSMYLRALLGLTAIALAGCSSEPKAVRSPGPTPAVSTGIPDSPTALAKALDAAPAALDASDPSAAVLTCQTVTASPAPGLCGIFETAPRADRNAAGVKQVIEVWQKLEGPVRALSGRETALVVLGPDARIDDDGVSKPVPPAAFICPGAPPTVYVPSSLLDLVGKGKKHYPVDFLAFVLGHELGHRLNDLTPDGCQLAAFQRPGKGFREEELADVRSAFFITSAGYSASNVARADMVSRFLEAEYELGREDSKGRREALLGALGRFDGYEALYQVALVTALSGDMEAADRLLTWADELVTRDGVPLPELRVVRAITRIQRAANMAPWGAELGMPVGLESLRCTPVHPGHSSLWEEPSKRVRSPDIEQGRRLLQEALTLLSEAEARGATPFTVAAARSCAAVYLGDALLAKREQDRAEALLAKRAPRAVAQAIEHNRALVSFVDFARKSPVPDAGDRAALRAWADKMRRAVGGKKAPSALLAVAAQIADPDATPAAGEPTAPACKKGPAPTPLQDLPAAGSGHGQCPSGYTLHLALPSLDAAQRTGSGQGITV